MKQYFLVTIDVEPDCTTSWHYADPLTFHGVSVGIREILHPLFIKYGVKPTYLINNVVLEDEVSCGVLKQLPGEYELGTHLHPEFIAPRKQFEQYAGRKGEANCCFYDPEVESGKIESITALFVKQFGYQPVSFRAGRFSAGQNTIRSLQKLGYKVDTSVTPGVLWKDKTREGAVDYRRFPQHPYWISENAFEKESAGSHILLEVPVTIYNRSVFSIKRLAKSILNGRNYLIEHQWLRPHYSSYDGFLEIIDHVRQHTSDQPVILNMMFHNVEVLPGCSPYVKNEEEQKKYISSLEKLFERLKATDVEFVTLSQLYDRYKHR